VRDHPMWARYARAFDRALLTVLADGVNNQRLTNTEVLLSLLGLLAGTAFLAYVTSTVVEVIRGMNQVEEASRRKIIQVVSFMKNAKLPQELQNRVKTHLEHVLLRRRMALDTNELLRELSGPLRAEIALRRCHMLVLNPKMVGMLGSADGRVEPNFIKLLVTRLEIALFSPGDFVAEEGDVGNEVFFMAHGTVEVVVRGRSVATLTDGDCFGEIALLVPSARRTASIIAVVFCEAYQLSREAFQSCLEGFPDTHARIRKLASERVRELASQAAKPQAPPPATAPQWSRQSRRVNSHRQSFDRGVGSSVSVFAAAANAAHAVAKPPRGLLRRTSSLTSRSSNESNDGTKRAEGLRVADGRGRRKGFSSMFQRRHSLPGVPPETKAEPEQKRVASAQDLRALHVELSLEDSVDDDELARAAGLNSMMTALEETPAQAPYMATDGPSPNRSHTPGTPGGANSAFDERSPDRGVTFGATAAQSGQRVDLARQSSGPTVASTEHDEPADSPV